MPKTALKTPKVPNPARKPPKPTCRPHPSATPGSAHWVRLEDASGEVEHRVWAWVPVDHPSQEPVHGWWALDATYLLDEAHLAEWGWVYAGPARPPGATPLRVVK